MKKLLILFALWLPSTLPEVAFGAVVVAEQGPRLISQRQAAQAAGRVVKGRVLAVTLSKGKRPVYRVKILSTDGRVRIVVVDATSGRVLGG